MQATVYNFDGIVGPTHNYAGLSFGNVASMTHRLTVSNPKRAALEGLEKMRFVASLGVKQAVFPPQLRPDLATLRRLGFSGSDAQILEKAAVDDPILLAAACSASSMWAANAAMVSPGMDTTDARVHFTPANLLTQFHRSIEAPYTMRILKAIFHDPRHFAVHEPLPAAPHFADEGAANHTRLWGDDQREGIEIFCYGRRGFDPGSSSTRFPARQTLEACQAIARRHQLEARRVLFIQQNPVAIDAGAFHNDVVCVGQRGVLLMHEDAFTPAESAAQIAGAFERVCGRPLHLTIVPRTELSLEEAINTYLFNSQLVTLPNGGMALIAPVECREHQRARAVCEKIVAGDNPIVAVHYVDVRQSMNNGGGPACLRLRITLTDEQAAAMHQGVIFTQSLYELLQSWIHQHYRERLEAKDLSDPDLLEESRRALDELARILNLPGLYDFQGGADALTGG